MFVAVRYPVHIYIDSIFANEVSLWKQPAKEGTAPSVRWELRLSRSLFLSDTWFVWAVGTGEGSKEGSSASATVDGRNPYRHHLRSPGMMIPL